MQQKDLCQAYKFELPSLRIGTLDALMALCDELGRVDTQVESTCKRLVSLREALISGNADLQNEEPFTIGQHNMDTYCIKFRWDEAKFPIKTPLRTIVSIIQAV